MEDGAIDLIVFDFVGGLLSLVFGFLQALFLALAGLFGEIPNAVLI